jgi:hypothetical protein
MSDLELSFDFRMVYKHKDPSLKQIQITYNTEFGSSSIRLDERQLNLCLDLLSGNTQPKFTKISQEYAYNNVLNKIEQIMEIRVDDETL